MRAILPAALLVYLAACASAPPDTTAIIPFVSMDSMIVAPISSSSPRIEQLILSDTVLAMVERRETCANVDEALRHWAEGASAFNGALALGVHVKYTGGAARVLHTLADASVYVAGAAAGILGLNQLSKSSPDRDFTGAKAALAGGAALKFLDIAVWKSEAQDAHEALDAAHKIELLVPAATNLPERILALRGRCRTAAFDGQARELRSFQVALVSDFVNYVDRIPSRYIGANRQLLTYRQRLKWYEVRTDLPD